MTPHVLNGAFERVSRAEEHLGHLRRRIGGWLTEQENAVVCKFDPKPPHNFMVDTDNCVGPPLIVGILIGEVCYNLRSALDYLVFELAKLDSGSVQRGTQFLIEDTKKSFDLRAYKRGLLKGINPVHVAAIERLQPYMGCKWAASLRDISNPDKHRELSGIRGSWTAHASHDLNEPDPARLAAIPKPIRRTPHPVHGVVKVKLALTSTVELSDGTPVADALEEIRTQVANTLVDFRPEF